MKGTEIGRLPEMERLAWFSWDGVYRYTLERRWGEGPKVNMIMLNPSVADAQRDDRTIEKVMMYAHREGYRSVVITNLYALRATKPEDLWTVPDPIGPDNDDAIAAAALESDQVWVGWGTGRLAMIQRSIKVQEILHDVGVGRPKCLWHNSNGTPVHPLYQPNARPLIPWKTWY